MGARGVYGEFFWGGGERRGRRAPFTAKMSPLFGENAFNSWFMRLFQAALDTSRQPLLCKSLSSRFALHLGFCVNTKEWKIRASIRKILAPIK